LSWTKCCGGCHKDGLIFPSSYSAWIECLEFWPRPLNSARLSCHTASRFYCSILPTSKHRRRTKSTAAQLQVVSVDVAGVRARCLGVSPLRRANAHSGSHRGSRRSPEDSRLPRLTVAAPAGGSRSPQPPTQPQRILTANVLPSPMCTSAPVCSRPRLANTAFKSVCALERSFTSNPTKLNFVGYVPA